MGPIMTLLTFIITTFLLGNTYAFIPLTTTKKATTSFTNPYTTPFQPSSSSTTIIQQQQKQQIPKQRQTKLYVFGLGGPEIAVILIAGAFLLGPQKLAELGKDAGKIAGELKEV